MLLLLLMMMMMIMIMVMMIVAGLSSIFPSYSILCRSIKFLVLIW